MEMQQSVKQAEKQPTATAADGSTKWRAGPALQENGEFPPLQRPDLYTLQIIKRPGLKFSF